MTWLMQRGAVRRIKRLASAAGEWLASGRDEGVKTVIAAWGLFTLLAVVSAALLGDYRPLLRGLGVPVLPEPFEDLRCITSAIDCAKKGLDVLVENPCDHFGRPMNYPRVWLLLGALGVCSRHTGVLAIVLIAAFGLAYLYIARGANSRQGLIYAALSCSPSFVLALERANNDLLIFFLLVLALSLLKVRWPWRASAYVLLGTASVLKLYPVCSFFVAVREPAKIRTVVVSSIVLGFPAYLALTLEDLVKIAAATPESHGASYGARSAALLMARAGAELGLAVPAYVVHGLHLGAVVGGICPRGLLGQDARWPCQ